MEAAEAGAAARRTEGSIGTVLGLASDGTADVRVEAGSLLACAVRGSRSDRLRLAAGYPPAGARGAFSGMLDVLERTIRDAASVAAGVPDAVLDPGIADRITEVRSMPPERLVDAARHVETARDAAAGNGNPQGIVAVLLADLAATLET